MLGDLEAEPAIAYGVLDSSYEEIVDEKWLRDNFPAISVYFSEVDNGGFGAPIYGYKLKLDQDTGVISRVSDKRKQKMSELHSILYEYHKTKGSKNLPKLGYHLVLDDDNGCIDNTYIPDVTNIKKDASFCISSKLPFPSIVCDE